MKVAEQPKSRLEFRAFANADKKQSKLLQNLIGGAVYSYANKPTPMEINSPGIVPRDITVSQIAKENMDFRIARANLRQFQKGVLEELAARKIGGPAQSGILGPDADKRPGIVGTRGLPGVNLPAAPFAREMEMERRDETPLEVSRMRIAERVNARMEELRQLGNILPDNPPVQNRFVTRTPAQAALVQDQLDQMLIGEPNGMGTLLGTAQEQLGTFPVVETPSVQNLPDTMANEFLENEIARGSINPEADAAADIMNLSGALLMPNYASASRTTRPPEDEFNEEYLGYPINRAEEILEIGGLRQRLPRRVINVNKAMARQALTTGRYKEQYLRAVGEALEFQSTEQRTIEERAQQITERARRTIEERAQRERNRNSAVYRSMLATADGKPGSILDTDAKD